jgi:hypothetical protein
MFLRARKVLAAVAVAVGLGVSGPSSAVPIELALVLDASGSISPANWTLQVQGYANALAAVLPSHLGQVAISVTRFAQTSSVVMGMTTINNAGDVTNIVNFFNALAQAGNGNLTCISCGIASAEGTLTGTATKSIIDVSTDGVWNVGVDPAGPAGNVGTSAWAVANDADVVNALGIGVLPNFAFGPGSFNVMAPDFAAFEATLIAKLGRELPEPGPLVLLAIGLLAMVVARRRA